MLSLVYTAWPFSSLKSCHNSVYVLRFFFVFFFCIYLQKHQAALNVDTTTPYIGVCVHVAPK